MPICAELDNSPASPAMRGPIGGRIGQFLEVEFIRTLPNIHFGFKGVPADRAGFPISGVFLGMMVSAERISPMISRTAVGRIRKKHILVFIIADPLSATLGPSQLPRFPTQSASGLNESIVFVP